MDQGDQQLIDQLKGALAADGRRTAFAADEPDENPLETDFFKAMNAFRAARSAGDAEAIAAAEERLRQTVRAELTGEDKA